MKFHDPKLHTSYELDVRDIVTVEIGRESWRDGLVVECHSDGVTVHVLREILAEAFELAAEHYESREQMSQPGWWALMVGFTMQRLGPTKVQRFKQRARRHAVMLVADRSLAAEAPDWPLVRLAPTMPWLDLRGEAALAHGPTGTELAMYREAAGIGPETTDGDLRYAFEHGILEWIPGEPRGRRRGIRAAGS